MKRVIFAVIAVITSLSIITAALFYNGIIWFVYPEWSGYDVKGIDVARYQGKIDWQEIYNQGITFAFIKATEGSSYSDPNFEYNIVNAKGNGVYTGAYHFFSTESPGKTQAENFINTVKNYSLDLPPVLDFEIPKTAADRASIVAEAKIFLSELEEYFGKKVIIYTTYESYYAFLADDFSEYPLWLRDLFKEPDIPGVDWTFWQYCNRGRLKGIDKVQKYVDLNVFNGNIDEFAEYINN